MMETKIPKVVLTGGPCAGKTETLKYIQDRYPNTVTAVPEAARLVLESGFPLPNEDFPWSQNWQYALQDVILPMQLSIESVYENIARATGKKALVCDRGILDFAAYFDGGLQELGSRYNLDTDEVLERYAAIIHLESVAVEYPELYQGDGRLEDAEGARAKELLTREVWEAHPNRFIVRGSDEFTKKAKKVSKILENILNSEEV